MSDHDEDILDDEPEEDHTTNLVEILGITPEPGLQRERAERASQEEAGKQ